MAYIPQGAKWYVADLVIAISVGGRKRLTVHLNTVLVRADSPTEAYERSVSLGREHQMTYRNAAGERVHFKFLGLAELTVIHDDLEHGCELLYRQKLGRTQTQARSLVTPRSRLGVFSPPIPNRAPDYMSGDIRRELEQALATGRIPKTTRADNQSRRVHRQRRRRLLVQK
jgi:hypothetical protein